MCKSEAQVTFVPSCVYVYVYIYTHTYTGWGKSNLRLDTVVKYQWSGDFCATLYIMNFLIFFKCIRKEGLQLWRI